jgi:RND family efflux transporter MFP subunit
MSKKVILSLIGLVIIASSVFLLYPKFFSSKKAGGEVLYWTDPMIPGFKSPTPGKSPMGMEMIPVYADSQMAGAQGGHAEHAEHGQENEIDYYTCTMHPSVKSKEPGKCPICSMDLVPVMKKPQASTEQVDLSFSVSPVKQQLIGVKFSEVEMMPLQKTIRAVGRVDYDERKVAVVNLKISGWIKDLLVDYTGQLVRKGQPLFTIYSPELVSTQEEYLQALRALQNTPAAVANADNRQQPSGIAPVYINPQEVLNTARQRLLLWDITEDQIAELEKRGKPETYLTLHSPINGHVIMKMALKGMHVDPGMELYKIADLSTVWVYADVYEYELPFVKIGQNATITLSYLPGETFEGRITYVFPYLNINTRTARVRIELPNREGKLRPEMYAEVEIFVDLGNKLAIPQSAVLNTGVRQIVFVDQGDGIFEVRFVQLGARAKGLYEITEGLKAGERVVSYANFLIDAESKVQGVLQRLEQ